MNHNTLLNNNFNHDSTHAETKILASDFLTQRQVNGAHFVTATKNKNGKTEQVLQRFTSHTLTDLDKANLMNRVDTKFLLPIDFLPELLAQLTSFYSVLEINEKRISTYYNQYFDTPALSLYHTHHNGKLNRFKVRHRQYLDTETEFLEVKFKNNQKRTLKTRIQVAGHRGQLTEQPQYRQYLIEQMGELANQLNVTQHSGYQRIALANEKEAERLTIDFNLWYKNPISGKKIELPQFFIAELKQAKKSKRSPFFQLMSKNNNFPVSFSKYCMGCALLDNTLKANRFKALLVQLEKLKKSHPYFSIKSK